ncbi:MAG: hypothetical protein KF887_07060 [Paracoccaceae bacterium]|nr:MAG: hypothetical protein KF887_07060 [Paracoccaceae bacterium]
MPATPAEVANDLAAQGAFFLRRDEDVARACREAARVIRKLLAGEHVDGRTWHGLQDRMTWLDFRFRSQPDTQIAKSISRGLQTLRDLRAAG